MLIQDYLYRSAEKFPEKIAIIQQGKGSTFKEILSSSKAIANWLIEQKLKPGERVAILMDDPLEYVISYFGVLMAGGIVVALNTQTSERTLKYLINHCTVSIVLFHFKFIKYFNSIANHIPSVKTIAVSDLKQYVMKEVPFKGCDFKDIFHSYSNKNNSFPKYSSSEIAQIIYTSGTTGESKGVMLRHKNLICNTNSIVEYLNLTENDRVMAVLPFFYSYGNSILLTHFAVGGTLIVNQNFLYPNLILEDMIQEKVTGFSGVPSTYAILLNRSAIHNYNFPDLRYITQAGGAMSPTLIKKLKGIFSQSSIYIMYGQTEASARLSYLNPRDLSCKTGSIGKAIPGVKLELLDSNGNPVRSGQVGEIVAKGENIMAGYWRDPEKTAQVVKNGALWTGDLATIDEQGYFYIVSRKSEIIKSGAHRISPKEIEEIILEHNSVHEAAVIGIEDDILGESIRACVVLKETAVCTKRELVKHCRKQLPTYKIPHNVEFYKELPKTMSGKIKKRELI